MPDPLVQIDAIACPLLRDNVDTDAIIPASENTRVSNAGYGDALFASWRYEDVGAWEIDPSFVLNKPPFDRAEILITGANFGCGSSRESAVWALRDFGFKVVIAESFNETFFRNCIVNGLAPLAASRADLERAARRVEEEPNTHVEVKVRERQVRVGTCGFAVDLDDYYGRLLTEGTTEDQLIADLKSAIEDRREALVRRHPWLVTASAGADDAA